MTNRIEFSSWTTKGMLVTLPLLPRFLTSVLALTPLTTPFTQLLLGISRLWSSS